MKGRIDKNGTFQIHRAGQWIAQVCPHSGDSCGDTCPLFGEPEFLKAIVNLEICQGRVLQFEAGDFSDEREVGDE